MKYDHINPMISKLSENEHDSFSFEKGNDLRDLIRTHKVPPKPGIYLIFEIKDQEKELVYIGKSGTWHQGEGFGEQMLDKRLHMKQEGEYRQDFFTRMVKKGRSSLEIHWFITCDDKGQNGQLPAKVESDLMQAFFEDNHELPAWNNSF